MFMVYGAGGLIEIKLNKYNLSLCAYLDWSMHFMLE